MTVAYITEFGLALLFGATAVWALAWAIRSGQFADFGQGAASIFDEEEPVGQATDSILTPSRPSPGDPPCQP